MKEMTGAKIRQAFLDFFAEKGHMIEPGAPLVPNNDPTLLWINSGVAALKKYFDGSIQPLNNRIANAQKSIRTNDIENVGKTARHHTFFEMLGNFSIGDYFKEEAIAFAWEFITSDKWMGFDAKHIYISVHPDDQQAYDIWVNVIGMNPNKILKSLDNFWQIGDGPCGPNSEIYYDRGETYDPEGIGERLFFEELENERYVEIWNIVFSQFDGVEGVARKDYKELPQKNIDTGMGLERLVAIAQSGKTNFDTDLFLPIIKKIEKYATISYGTSEDMAYRVIADHLRTVTFALADGALFANEGRGYVLRRVLRRAVRYGLRLGIVGSFMNEIVPTVVKIMEDFYPYLVAKIDYIRKLVKIEEDRFHTTLADGENLLKQIIKDSTSKLLAGDDVFKLYDTYGFPLELTKEIANEQGIQVDEDGFKTCMESQRNRARAARGVNESMSSQSIDLMNFKETSEFHGYSKLEHEGKVIGLFKACKKVKIIDDEGDVIFDHSVFYAESGGQVADIGIIFNDQITARVTDVKKAPHKQHLLHVIVEKGELTLGCVVQQEIAYQRRRFIARHHSSAHLLQSALKAVIGDHVSQAGSYVAPEYLRFDFTHYAKVSQKELLAIELLVNEYIELSNSITTEYMNIVAAKEMGATALFDEKYGEQVRVVQMGEVSLELCGGCHVENTSEIGVFKILAEESIGSGIRRITACCNLLAYQEFKQDEDLLIEIAELLKAPSSKLIIDKLNNLIVELKMIKQQNQLLQQKITEHASSNIEKGVLSNGVCPVAIVEVTDEIVDLKKYVEKLNTTVNGIVFAYQISDKLVCACSCNPLAIEKGFQAGNIVKIAATICEGNGGGRADLAQAGGKNITKIADMLVTVKKELGI